MANSVAERLNHPCFVVEGRNIYDRILRYYLAQKEINYNADVIGQRQFPGVRVPRIANLLVSNLLQR